MNSPDHKGTTISRRCNRIFKTASIQPRFPTLTLDDVSRLESLAKEVKTVLDRGRKRDDTPEWLKPHTNGNGTVG